MKAISPKEVDKYVEKLLKKIGSEYEPEQVPVKVEPYSKSQNCFINVEEKVKKDGGSVYYGWNIFQSEIICEAERHAVWESAEGDLIDITPNELDFEQIMFVPDNDFVYTGQLVDNIRINITDNPLVDDFIFLCENIEKLYSYGQRIDDEQMSVPEPAVQLIPHLEQFKANLLNFINSGARPSKPCYCGSPKIYKNCHGKDFRKDVSNLVAKVERILKKSKGIAEE
ncbi:SEC-C domain-containing protein [Rufibacter sediminis]|uniref:SEC-C domain-containing protein n=1 Tax=Rufibacter sediminis TaxID=2762756 RepID=A0ABR6VPT2_9BACT|nr:SEC-C domain-containing protein [Rufibacter sediminis]MBC3538611.1 SEC-C domain-containing protein [Rufibacter sediminis]